jgi:hypothetical protein
LKRPPIALEPVQEIVSVLEIPEDAATTVALDQHFSGGSGIDTLSYSGTETAIEITVANGAGVVSGIEIGNDSFEGIEVISGGEGDDTFIVGEGVVSLDGKSGNDLFVFMSDTTIASGTSSTTISNFEVGDIVRMSKYDIFERAVDKLEDAIEDKFDQIYGYDDHNDLELADAIVPIRLRHDFVDQISRTYIEADTDFDGVFDVSVVLDGHRDLVIVTNEQT